MNPDFIAMEEKKSNRNFWIAFVLLVLIAAGATYRNLQEYNSMDKLNVEGKRILLPVDSLVQMGDRQMIFVHLNLDGQQYVVMGIARDNTGAALAAENPAEDSYTDAFVRLDSLEDIPKRLGYAITLPQWLPEGVRVRAVFAMRNEQFDIISVQYQDGDAQILLDFTYYRDTSAFGVSYEQDEEGKTIALENGSNIYVISNEQSLWGLYQDGRVFYHIDAIGYDVNTLLAIFNSI